MFTFIRSYTRWLHTGWPAGVVERLPAVAPDGSTAVPGLYVVGDLTGIPLLKFSADTGARAVGTIVADPAFARRAVASDQGDVLDMVIIGGGVSGMAAALEARKHGLRFEVIEATEPFSTIVNFPKAKPIYTYPTEMTPAGDLQFTAQVKEPLVDELRAQTLQNGIKPRIARAERIVRRDGLLEVQLSSLGGSENRGPKPETIRAHRAIIAIGRSGNFRKLGVPGEDAGQVFNRLHDPKDYAGMDVLVVGGGDSAIETAIAIAECGGNVTLSYRKPQFSRPKPVNLEKLERLHADPMADVQIEAPSSERVTTAVGNYMASFRKPGSVRLMMSSKVRAIGDHEVVIVDDQSREQVIPNDAVFTMIGREPPLDFLRRSGVSIRGEWRATTIITFVLVLLAAFFVYHWKKTGLAAPAGFAPAGWVLQIGDRFAQRGWFPYNVPAWWHDLGGPFTRPSNLLGTLRLTVGEPGFYYSVAYCLCVSLFGVARIRRRKTPYVTAQTLTLIVIQVVPLFLLPYVLLPWAGYNGWFDSGALKSAADALFPQVNYGHGREYWRAFGLVLAWPLFFWNVFTAQPMWTWLAISFVQTFIIIPLIIYRWGKGAYCGWICSCGALAETMGDAHRQKMPHGPFWNRLNMLGQFFLAVAFALLVGRSTAWVWPEGRIAQLYEAVFHGIPFLNYVWFVDLLWAGVIGVGFYWHFSGRVWCRFACPLAALMHIYARFSRFRILADKKKCISCNVCTSVCHQGIDVMNFANKGMPMEDPQCVRCSACVQSCPTGVLSFGQVDRRDGRVIRLEVLAASPVRSAETDRRGHATVRSSG